MADVETRFSQVAVNNGMRIDPTFQAAAFFEWRKRCNFTQKNAGIMIGKNLSQVARYENGASPIPYTVMLACLWVEMEAAAATVKCGDTSVSDPEKTP